MTNKIFLPIILWAAAIATGWCNTVSGTITMSVDLSAHTQGKEVRLWLPYPVSDSSQDITNISISGDYDMSAIHTNKKFQVPMLFAHWNASATNRFLSFSFQAQRMEQVRPAFPNTDSEWNKADYALYLQATSQAPLDPNITELAASITTGRSGLLEKTRAIYDWTVEHTARNPETRGCGAGNVCELLNDPCGKCADISSIFIALCRASGVPAREVLGLRMSKEPIRDITTWQHCWAEFFLPGAGWISVDPADVRKKMLHENLSIDDPATAAYREYFFGGLDAYRIKVGAGRDIHLSPEAGGGSINYLMYPFAQIGDQTLDWLDPENFTYSITFSSTHP